MEEKKPEAKRDDEWKDAVPAKVGTCFHPFMEFVIPMAVRGILWYQGEFNIYDDEYYCNKQETLIRMWRALWQEELPFYFVQLPNHVGGRPWGTGSAFVLPGKSDHRARMQEGQLRSLKVPKTGMVVTIDIGDRDDNHPPDKFDVGRRMTQLILSRSYARDDLVPMGPIYRSHQITGDRIVVSFDHVGKGLMVGNKPKVDGKVTTDPVEEVKGGALGHFAICGSDRVWYWAQAVIDGDKVVASSKDVPEPVALRYAFNSWPEGANLYNRDGLPASPFRTDDWPMADERKNAPEKSQK
jgi:sialate O-acetylesterase